MCWTPEEIAKIDAARWALGREKPGSWHELLARQKAINDAHDKDLTPSEYRRNEHVRD